MICTHYGFDSRPESLKDFGNRDGSLHRLLTRFVRCAYIKRTVCGCSSVVERQLAKLETWGSIPLTRSMNRRTFLLTTLASPWLRASDPPRTLLVGDSLAFMLSPALKAAGKRFGQVVATQARGGTTTAQWLKEGWFKKALASRPETVLVSLGTNDWQWDMFPERVGRLVQLAHDRKVEVVWLISPVKRKAKRIRPVIEQSASDFRHDASVLDLEMEKDRIHPTYRGIKVWADALASFLWS